MDMLINCQHLTLEEKRRILEVLQRDDALQQTELTKVQALKEEVKDIRHQSVIKAGDDPEKTCVRCRARFGYIFDRGNLCPKCHSKVCQQCMMQFDTPGRWLCRLCYKQRELDKVSGNWLKKQAKKKGVSREQLVPGSVLVKASIKKELGISSSYCTCGSQTAGDCCKCLIKYSEKIENKSAADDLREALSSDGSPISQRSHLSSQDGGSTGDTNIKESESSRGLFSDLVNFRVPGSTNAGQQNGEIRVQKARSRHRSESSDSDEELPEMPDLIPSGKQKKSGSRTPEYTQQQQQQQRSPDYSPRGNKPIDRHLDLKNIPRTRKNVGPGSMASSQDEFDVEDLTKVKFHRMSKHRPGDRTPSPSGGGHARSSSDSGSDEYLEDDYTLNYYNQEYPSESSEDELQESHEFSVYVGNASFVYCKDKVNQDAPTQLNTNILPTPKIILTKDTDMDDQAFDLDTGDCQLLLPEGLLANNNNILQGHSNDPQAKVKVRKRKGPVGTDRQLLLPEGHSAGNHNKGHLNDPHAKVKVKKRKNHKKPPPVHTPKGDRSTVFKRAVVNIMRARSLLLSQDSSDSETDTTQGSLSSIKEEESDLSDREEISHPESGYSSSLSTSQPKSQETDSSGHNHLQKRLSDASGVSVPSIEVTHPNEGPKDDDEDIDELVKSHRSTSSLLTPHGSDADSNSSIHHASSVGSKESITSYYSDAGEGLYGMIPVEGEIQFGLDYNYKTGTFIIILRQCRDLSLADPKKKRTDPYVKVYLLPDKTRTGKRKSKVKKNTINPQFEEQIRYTLCKSELESRTLWISVWHNDTFGRNAFLGEVLMPMDYYEFQDPTPEWHQLQERPRERTSSLERITQNLPKKLLGKKLSDDPVKQPSMSFLSYKGDLIVAMKFVPPEAMNIVDVSQVDSKGELHCCVKEARNLTAVRANGHSDPFVKGYLLPNKNRNSKQKTPTIKKNCNPKWNHVLKFDDVSLEDLPMKCLELTVWDHDRISSNQFLGGTRLNMGPTSPNALGDWMDAKGEEVSIWRGMLDRPNVWVEGSIMLRPNMDRRH
ncbi:synaptotagmin-like protein 4 isoform X3 [Lineus longissimus]|uniref:synaptotagmin-like protein 4 isoform X3 n=1 Tax=Lineus longissimus TaxID=88925 RepID=UPI00315DADBB